jgi:hypothetical protein
VTRLLAAILLGITIGVLLVPRLSSSHNLRGTLEQRAHHGATALLWLEAHPVAARRSPRLPGDRAALARRHRRSTGGHYWLLMNALKRSGFFAGAVCVHSKEGPWNDPDSPHWGGMQMDYSFQSSHGPAYLRRWGTADNWPVWAQLHASYDAWTTRGWHPWPNTARACGLL